jgi:hypothetical protein
MFVLKSKGSSGSPSVFSGAFWSSIVPSSEAGLQGGLILGYFVALRLAHIGVKAYLLKE